MENQEKLNLGTQIAQWIQKRRKILLVIFVILVAALIILGILSSLASSKSLKAAESLAEFEKLYTQWNNATTEEREGFRDEIEEMFTTIDADYSGTYAHQRSLFMMGDYYFATEEWEKSSEKYLALADQYDESYLAPVALYNSAAALEEMGKNDMALENYKKISAEYNESALAPRSLFSIGRLEEHNSSESAVGAYNELIESYPQSNWTKLARSRIIALSITK